MNEKTVPMKCSEALFDLPVGARIDEFVVKKELDNNHMWAHVLVGKEGCAEQFSMIILHEQSVGQSQKESLFARAAERYKALSRAPCVPRYMKPGAFRDRPYFLLTYPEGDGLEMWSKKRHDVNMLHYVKDQVFLGFGMAHQQGVIHGAAGPWAVRVSRLGEVIIDFWGAGLPHLDDPNALPRGREELAPEVAPGVSLLESERDTFAVGQILFTSYSGCLPFPKGLGEPFSAYRRRVRAQRPPRVGDIRPELACVDRFLMRALIGDPALRYKDMAELYVAHNRLLSLPMRSSPASNLPRTQPRPAPARPAMTATKGVLQGVPPLKEPSEKSSVESSEKKEAPTAEGVRAQDPPATSNEGKGGEQPLELRAAKEHEKAEPTKAKISTRPKLQERFRAARAGLAFSATATSLLALAAALGIVLLVRYVRALPSRPIWPVTVPIATADLASESAAPSATGVDAETGGTMPPSLPAPAEPTPTVAPSSAASPSASPPPAPVAATGGTKSQPGSAVPQDTSPGPKF